MRQILLSVLLLTTAACTQNARFTAIPSVSQRPATPSECTNGGIVVTVNGTENIICNGANGSDGSPGSSCSVASMIGGATITCTDGTSAVVLNGQDGAPATGLGIKEIVHPCGQLGVTTEILLRLTDNTIIAHYAGNGTHQQFLSLLTPGNYSTTGVSGNCNFNIGPAPNYNVTY
jgi:hypothetical protein